MGTEPGGTDRLPSLTRIYVSVCTCLQIRYLAEMAQAQQIRSIILENHESHQTT